MHFMARCNITIRNVSNALMHSFSAVAILLAPHRKQLHFK